MKKEPVSELECKRNCDMAAKDCEESSIYLEECETKWDHCMGDCLDGCEIYS
jgi:hypothetical protein